MTGIDGKKFSMLTSRYHCDEDVLRQIREFITTTMIPDENIVLNHCILTATDLSQRKLLPLRQTRYFDVAFHVMYYQMGSTFIGEPVLEITYNAAWELSKDEYEQRMTEQTKAHILLKQAMEIINPSGTE